MPKKTPAKYKEYSDEWYTKNRDEILSKGRKAYQENPEIRQVKKSYYQIHKEKIKERTKKYYQDHKDEMKKKKILWRNKNKDKHYMHNIKYAYRTRYGITVDQYIELYESQHGECAICKRPQNQFKKRFSVDHSHKTGKIRGLLCPYCNNALGMFSDDIENLNNAIRYLNSHRD